MPPRTHKSASFIMDTDSEVKHSDSDMYLSDLHGPRTPSPPANPQTQAPKDAASKDEAAASRPSTPMPATRKKRKKKSDEKYVYSFCPYTVDLRTNGFNNAPENEKTTPAAKSLTYILAILSAEELKKPTSRQQAKTVSLTLASNEPWDTLKAQLLVKINSALSPAKIDFADYEIKYYILRILPKPGLELETDQQYQDLIKRSQDIKGNTPTISVVVWQLTSRVAEDAGKKENVEATAMLASKGNKRTCRDPETLPGNVAKNSNIQCLQEQWKCQKQQNTCVGVYCFPNADTGEHLPLSHERLDCWASAMLKGEESATLYKPPNHRLFDTKQTALSPVLQRRIEAQNQKNTPPTQPVFNLTLGNELVGLFCQPAKALAPAPVPAPAPMPILDPAPAPVSNHHIPVNCPFLLPPSCSPGTEMSLSTFCTTHELGDAILARLNDNCYKKSSALHFITIQELKEMGFRLREIAALCVAVDSWSTA